MKTSLLLLQSNINKWISTVVYKHISYSKKNKEKVNYSKETEDARTFKFELHQTNKLDVVFDSNYASSGFDISSVLKIGATLTFYSDSLF